MEGELLLPLYLYRLIRLDFVTFNLVVVLDYTIIILGGMSVLITDEDCRVEAHERLFLIRLEKTEEYLVPLIQILPIQLMADYLAKQKGIPAGTFRWGSKVMDSEI